MGRDLDEAFSLQGFEKFVYHFVVVRGSVMNNAVELVHKMHMRDFSVS